MGRIKRKRSKILLIGLAIAFLYISIKTVFSYLPVEVVPAKSSVLEDVFEGEFIILRQETVVTAPFTGNFKRVVNEGERVAKDTVLGFMEKTDGTSLEKQLLVPIKAETTGIVYYYTDGLESICNPQTWVQLDLSKLELLENYKETPGIEPAHAVEHEKNKLIKSGEGFLKIVDNLVPCYFYLAGSGAYPEKVKVGDYLDIRLDKNPDGLFNGEVVEVFRRTDSYGILLKVSHNGVINKNRKEKGTIILESYQGVILPKKALVKKEGKDGVYLFKKGKACWREVEIVAQLREKLVLTGLAADEWIITNPQLVSEGKRITRLNK